MSSSAYAEGDTVVAKTNSYLLELLVKETDQNKTKLIVIMTVKETNRVRW